VDVLPYFEIGKNQQREHHYFTGLMDHSITDPLSPAKCRNALWKPRSHRAMSKIPTLMAYSGRCRTLPSDREDGKRQSTAVAFLRPIKDRLDHSNRSIGDSFTLEESAVG